MLTVSRSNVVLNIADVELQHYLDKGYNLLDNSGHIIQEAVPKNLNELQKAFIDHTKRIQELEGLVDELTAKLEAKGKPGRKPAEKPIVED